MQRAATSGSNLDAHPIPDIRVERADAQRPDDALALIEEYYDAINVTQRDDRESLLRYLSNPQSAIWVAYCGSAAIACILYRPLPNFDAAGEIKRLYVRPPHRGRGVARLLLHTSEQFARRHKIAWLYLDTKDDLTNAIAFYRRHGYNPCARYNDNPQATIFMRKQLLS